MLKKNLAIIMGITSNLTFALANVIFGLKKYSPAFADEIIIYHDGINEKDKQILSSVLPCRFIDYDFPIKDTSNFNQVYFNQFSKLAYSRYEGFNLLNEFTKVMWLDVDLLIQKDVSGLENYAQTGYGMLAPLDDDFKLKNQFLEPVNTPYDMEKKAYSSGVVILQDNLLNYDKMTQWCYDKTAEFADKLYLPDQAVLNMLIQEFNINVMEIELENYSCHPNHKNHKNSAIVHSYRPEKFWNFFPYKEWYENYKQWILLGGTPTKTKKANIITRYCNKIMPEAPDPFRKPRQFVIAVYKRLRKSCLVKA